MKVTANSITKAQLLDSLSTAVVNDKNQDIVGFEFDEHTNTLTFWWFLEEGLEVTIVSNVALYGTTRSSFGTDYHILDVEVTEVVLGCVNTLDYSDVNVEGITYEDLKESLYAFFAKENKMVSGFCNKYYFK